MSPLADNYKAGETAGVLHRG